jgi:ribosome-associated protein
MPRRAAPHRGLDVHYGDGTRSGTDTSPEDSPADSPTETRPSKTQLKQQAKAQQTLGAELAALSEDRLAAIDMPEALRDAIHEFRRTKSFEGRRRQYQYLGKLMRSADEDALREAVAAATVGSAKETLALHVAEHWRSELVASDDAMTRWMGEHPETDAQQLRSLVRAARRDAAAHVPEARQPRSFRELFQFIKPLLAQESKP